MASALRWDYAQIVAETCSLPTVVMGSDVF
jgi:hypothetical protein